MKKTKKAKMTKEERRTKYTDIARKRRQNKHSRKMSTQKLVCYHCRKTGHTVANCPQTNSEELLCYKCGSSEHGLHTCPLRQTVLEGQEELPFATCFVCKEKGHLASACPQNKNGIYVNKGKCRFCGSVEHLATGCPQKQKKNKKKDDLDVDLEDLLEQPTQSTPSGTATTKKEQTPTSRRVVNF